MIEWLISFGNGCHYITMAFLLLYLLWLVRESFRTRKSGVVREEIMCSDDAGKCFLALWLAAEYLMRENFPFSLYPHYTCLLYTSYETKSQQYLFRKNRNICSKNKSAARRSSRPAAPE